MFVGQQQPIIQFKREDLSLFKNMVSAFLISKILYFIGYFIYNSFIWSLIDDAGTLALIYGIFYMSKKYPELITGRKVAYLFILGLGIDLISTIYNYIYPISSSAVNGQNTDQIISQLKPIVQQLYILTFLGFLSGILTFIIAYYFTEWFNSGFSDKNFNHIKSFLYFGIIMFLGQAINAFSEGLIIEVLTNFINNNATATISDVNNLNNANNIAIIGILIILAGVIMEIIASIKIYNRVNDFFTGKYYFMAFNYPFSPYQQNLYQQPNQFNPYQQPNQFNPYQQQNQANQFNPYQQPNQPNPNQQSSQQQFNPSNQNQNNFNTETGISTEPGYLSTLSSMNESSDKHICDNCGTNLPVDTKFCYKCGKKVG